MLARLLTNPSLPNRRHSHERATVSDSTTERRFVPRPARRPRAQALLQLSSSRDFVLAIAARILDATTMTPVFEHPDDQDLSRRFVELRIAADLDIDTVALRGGLDPEIARELEAGTRTWALNEIEAFARGLDMPLVRVFAPWGGPAPRS